MATEWTVETDEDAEDNRINRRRAFDERFQVIHPIDGFVEGFPTLGEAFACADRWEPKSGYEKYTTEVYDHMARRGCGQLWRRSQRWDVPDAPPNGEYVVERWDYVSHTAFWKCIACRAKGGR